MIYWLRQIENRNIKTILRGKAMLRSSRDIESKLFDLGTFTSLPIDDLMHAEDVSEVLRQLEKTCYASLAYYTHEQYEQQKDIFNLETSVDQQFFIGMLRRVNMLESHDKAQMHPLLGRIIDQMNLVRLLQILVLES